MKLGTIEINKVYLGYVEVLKAYLGTVLVYDKTAPIVLVEKFFIAETFDFDRFMLNNDFELEKFNNYL